MSISLCQESIVESGNFYDDDTLRSAHLGWYLNLKDEFIILVIVDLILLKIYI